MPVAVTQDAPRLLLTAALSLVQVSERVARLAGEVSAREAAQAASLAGLEAGVGTLFSSFSRLDNRIAGVGQTAARIGDHLQAADAQKDTALQTIDLIRYLQVTHRASWGHVTGSCSVLLDNGHSGLKWDVRSGLKRSAKMMANQEGRPLVMQLVKYVASKMYTDLH